MADSLKCNLRLDVMLLLAQVAMIPAALQTHQGTPRSITDTMLILQEGQPLTHK